MKFNLFKKDKSGVAAVEFALVAAPFFAILFATMEIAAIFWANGVLIEAVNQPSRDILVGHAQGATVENFRKAVCDKAKFMMDCDKLIIDVQTYESFAKIKTSLVIDPDTGKPIPPKFDTGKGGDIVVVRVGYPWPLMMPFLGFDASNSTVKGVRVLQAANVFKNEGF